jgi:hypothetical protein
MLTITHVSWSCLTQLENELNLMFNIHSQRSKHSIIKVRLGLLMLKATFNMSVTFIFDPSWKKPEYPEKSKHWPKIVHTLPRVEIRLTLVVIGTNCIG